MQITATHCNTLTRLVPRHFNTLQHAAKHGNTLQHAAKYAATRCNTLQQIHQVGALVAAVEEEGCIKV